MQITPERTIFAKNAYLVKKSFNIQNPFRVDWFLNFKLRRQYPSSYIILSLLAPQMELEMIAKGS